MSAHLSRFVFVLGVAAILSAACGRKESEGTAGQGEPAPGPAPGSVAGQAGGSGTLQDQAASAAARATAAVEVVQGEVGAAAAKVQGLIDQAKTFVTEKKWAEALQLLSNLSSQELTAEQQEAVKQLQEQAQQGAAEGVKAGAEQGAADAVNKLLTPRQ